MCTPRCYPTTVDNIFLDFRINGDVMGEELTADEKPHITVSIEGTNQLGSVVLRRRLRREPVVSFFANLSPCLVCLEACGGAHHWVRRLSVVGHTARLLAPEFVKPYVKSNKNDPNDAEALCEAAGQRLSSQQGGLGESSV